MRAITLWRPWSHLVFMGWKTIETRTHNRFRGLVGQTIAIHAGQRWDRNCLDVIGPYISGARLCQFLIDEAAGRLESTGVIGVATVEDARWLTNADSARALCEADGLFGLVMTRVTRLARPVPCRGKQGIWTLQPLVEAAVRSQLDA